MKDIRRSGPASLDLYLRLHGPAASSELDRVCAMKDAHTALLYWFTDLGAALAQARREKKPILSLRLLGRLDQELSCANSRFFRKLLYPDAQINRMLRDQFVLHWESVRPVPLVTINFGDGRRVERTLTGNSAHLVLDWRGRPVDVLPGLFDRDTFVLLLDQARRFADVDRRELARLHARARGPQLPDVAPSRAVLASRIAATKHLMEAPLLRQVRSDVDGDTRENLALHDRVHEAFAVGAEWAGIAGLVEWVYAELFQMPLSDPALGLDVPDPFDARMTA
ncbi:MAG TPA: hypothetical protein VIV11_10380 [Kofleriaceae bacterium]